MDLEVVKVYNLMTGCTITGCCDSYKVDPSLITSKDLLDSYLEEGFELIDSKSLLVTTYRELEIYMNWMCQYSKDFESLIACIYINDFYVLGIKRK